jgi:Xaa-Pro aminopeptidase
VRSGAGSQPASTVVSTPKPFRPPAIDFKAEQLDAFLVTGAANVRYLSGFTGSNGMILALPGTAVFFTDPRYAIQSSQEVAARTAVVKRGGLIAEIVKFVKAKRLRRLGFEKSHFSFEQYSFLQKQLGSKVDLKPLDDAVQKQRMVKTAEEIEAIRRSVETNSKAFARATRNIRPGVRETEIAAEIDYQMRRLGAERPAFETIVASGERTAWPHARPTLRALGKDELVLIDMGASREGYASDMTRMLHLGRKSRKIVQMYRAVLEAQLAGVDAVRPGATADHVDRAARQVLKKHGLDRAFTHSTGHGLGLEIHEPPRLGKGEKTRLEAGMTITVEPGAYIEGTGGIRIEDTVLVTAAGCEVLTPTPKELIAI